MQLIRLASQHHLSEYSRIKHGRQGCPVQYIPLEPDIVRSLRERQQTYYLDQVRWWPCTTATQRAPLQQQLSTALSESIPTQPTHVKTSESHPINVSQIIPPDSLLVISSHLTPCRKPSPVLFDIQFPYTLDSITGYPPPPTLPNVRISLPSSRIFLSLKRNLKINTQTDPAPRPRFLPPPPHIILEQGVQITPPKTVQNRKPLVVILPRKERRALFFLVAPLLSIRPSSVRLTGPVRGRSAVCRDLDVDLRRMKLTGARCIVCCLDDDELEFLIGMSWSQYCHVAHQEGLDVLRIPLPEGLTPLSPASLDADLDQIIEKYTLQGISVLVHCRGGVGRAGLFACCWMLKLGLCGWIETENVPPRVVDSDTIRWDSDTVVRRDTLQLVERVIEVVRRRRSVKAIETLEQVQFLVEYVDYLRTCGRTE